MWSWCCPPPISLRETHSKKEGTFNVLKLCSKLCGSACRNMTTISSIWHFKVVASARELTSFNVNKFPKQKSLRSFTFHHGCLIEYGGGRMRPPKRVTAVTVCRVGNFSYAVQSRRRIVALFAGKRDCFPTMLLPLYFEALLCDSAYS